MLNGRQYVNFVKGPPRLPIDVPTWTDEQWRRATPAPAPESEMPKCRQRELFVAAHGGTAEDAERDFERWWRAHGR